MSQSPAVEESLKNWERVVLVLFAGFLLWFGWLTVQRAVYQDEQKTDFGVYARSAWAVRTGQDPYSVASDRDWHYVYPPPFVLFVLPLADPPAGVPREGYLRFDVGVGIWYLLNLLAAVAAVHLFASAALPVAATWSRRWWYVRLLPFDFCLGGIGFTLSRGQTNILILLFLAGLFAASRRGRSFSAGLWLSAAACLKVIPGVMAVDPAVRGQWRAALGLTVGSFVLLFVLPSAVWGVRGAIEMNRTFVNVVLLPGSTNEGDQSRAKELTNTTATDNQSYASVIHCWRHLDRDSRPENADGITKAGHWLIGGTMLLLTAWVGRRSKHSSIGRQLISFGCFCAVMMLITPVSHMHYYVLILPLVAGVVVRSLEMRPGNFLPGFKDFSVLALWSLLTNLPLLPGEEGRAMRELGMGTFATTGLWAYGLIRSSSKA